MNSFVLLSTFRNFAAEKLRNSSRSAIDVLHETSSDRMKLIKNKHKVRPLRILFRAHGLGAGRNATGSSAAMLLKSND